MVILSGLTFGPAYFIGRMFFSEGVVSVTANYPILPGHGRFMKIETEKNHGPETVMMKL
jgi:hypothetical protein